MRAVVVVKQSSNCVYLSVKSQVKPTDLIARLADSEGKRVVISSPFGVWNLDKTDIADIADTLITVASALRRLQG